MLNIVKAVIAFGVRFGIAGTAYAEAAVGRNFLYKVACVFILGFFFILVGQSVTTEGKYIFNARASEHIKLLFNLLLC